jgi:uncharacterized protein (TIGR02145 family)
MKRIGGFIVVLAVALVALMALDAVPVRAAPISTFGQSCQGAGYTAVGQNSPGVGGTENIVMDIDDNMIPIYYDTADNAWKKADPTKVGNDTTYTTDADFNTNHVWYNYNAHKWANAVTVTGGGVLDGYKAAAPGTIINDADVLGYWVYIPRYRYKVQRCNYSDQVIEKATAFDIQFENKNAGSSTPGNTLDDYQKAFPSVNGDWATHPAFTFAGDIDRRTKTNQELAGAELNGLWVGKYETTGTAANPTIRETDARWADTTVNSFNYSKLMGQIDQSGKPGGANQHSFAGLVDTRMTKNDDWGAIAYFATSKFGNNTIEPAVTTASTTLADSNTATTGNQYGIYDMVGGTVLERTLSIYGNSVLAMPDKYYNGYTNSPITSCTFVLCGGQAIYETAISTVTAWNADTISWPASASTNLVARRGGTTGVVGLFTFSWVGNTTSDLFRTVAHPAVLDNIFSYPNGDTYLQVYGTGIELGSKIYVGGQECTNRVIRSATMATCDTPTLGSLGAKAVTIVPPDAPTGNIQNFAETCTAPYGTIRVLTDTRDGQAYRVRCMEYAHWWMIDNLKLAGGTTLNASNTNLDGSEPADFASAWATITAPVQSSATHSNGRCTADSTATLANGSGYLTCDGAGYADANDGFIAYSDPSAATDYSAWVCNNQIMINPDSHTDCGYLYNWYTATAGTGNYQKSGTYVASSICPVGWHLSNNTVTNDFGVLNASMLAGAPASSSTTSSAVTRPHWRYNGEWQGTLSGYYSYVFFDAGRSGIYWSARAETGATMAASLTFNALSVNPGLYWHNKHFGHSVRCML